MSVGGRGMGRTMAIALVMVLLSGCGLLGGGRVAAEHFEDPAAQELAQAVADGKLSTIRELVADGTSVDSAGKDGITMAQWAVFERQHRSLETLLELGADIELHGLGGSTVLHSAAIVDNPRYLRTLLEAGADPDLRHAQTERTPLMGATGARTMEHFTLLLEAGADIDLTDRTGNTALHLAAMVNAGEQVLMLLERGADPLARNAQDATFQDYFWTTNANVMNERGLESRRQVAEWLEQRNVSLAPNARWTKDEEGAG